MTDWDDTGVFGDDGFLDLEEDSKLDFSDGDDFPDVPSEQPPAPDAAVPASVSVVKMAERKRVVALDNATSPDKLEKPPLAFRLQIAEARKKLDNMTQKQLAAKLNVTVAVIQGYESGKVLINKALENKIRRALKM